MVLESPEITHSTMASTYGPRLEYKGEEDKLLAICMAHSNSYED
jgi:hypothetical protein